MGEEQKKQLEQQLWNIANTLRGKMDADEFRDYILGFIFYKYLSEKMNGYADDILAEDNIKFKEIDEDSQEGKEYLEAVREESIEQLGYFLKPSELFSAVARRGSGDSNNFILEDLTNILNSIEQSTMGQESEDDFEHLFEDLDLSSTKLGRSEEAKNSLIAKVLSHLDKIDFELKNHDSDVLGDAYEYLIGQFASGAGKKAGEFYTPQEVSKILAKIVTTNKERLKSVYDPTCGSGSLLLRVAKEVGGVSGFYGQELNRTTYNLARMNMIMHDVHYRDFDIRQEDTIENPQHLDNRFEAIVANPPFSAHWSANPLHLSDDRFSQYGKLAPKTKADFAFIQHMIYHLDDNGTMAVVMPHGVLFRGASEGHIRRYLIEDRNYLDAVIGLPANIFYGTSIPTTILVFKKCREDSDCVLFIDASAHFEKVKNQNHLRVEDIEKIVTTYQERKEIEKYSHKATLAEIAENDYNLNIPRYVDTFEEEEAVDLAEVCEYLNEMEKHSKENDKVLFAYCDELGLPKPMGNNSSLLEEYKKGVMQKIFSQEIRFKHNDGGAFGGWKEVKISDTLKIGSGRDYKHLEKGAIPVYGTGGYMLSVNKFLYDGESVCIGRKGTIDKPMLLNGKFWTVDTLFYTYEFNKVIPKFIYLIFQRINWKKFNEASGVPSLSKKTILNIKIEIPQLEEQQKIANFLTSIDKKITQTNQSLEQMKAF